MVAELEKVFFTNFQNYFLDILQDTNIPGQNSLNNGPIRVARVLIDSPSPIFTLGKGQVLSAFQEKDRLENCLRRVSF